MLRRILWPVVRIGGGQLPRPALAMRPAVTTFQGAVAPNCDALTSPIAKCVAKSTSEIMDKKDLTHFRRLYRLVLGNFSPPPGRWRIATALLFGIVCHAVFAVAVLAMIVAMFFGMSESFGNVPQPWAWVANIALVLQFPLTHSFLLSNKGRRLLARLAPTGYGKTLSTTTYAIIASAQLFVLFAFWTPCGGFWWRAEVGLLARFCVLYGLSWLLLIKASYDAGAEVQSGALGWMSLLQKITPNFPDMPTTGLFRIVRQPIYVAFALTLWTVPVWTPDQLLLAISFTSYCLLAPRLKERRFAKIYGARFARYKARVPYIFPRFRLSTSRRNSAVRRG